MRLHTALLGPLVLVLSLFFVSPAQSAIIGIDAVHGFDEDARLTGSDFNFFRSSLAGLGHTLVNLNSFDDVSLAGVDVAILMTAYDNGPSYTSAQVSAINSFADTRAAFVSDSNLWSNFSVGADAHIFMGDNLRLLENIVNFLAAGGGALYIGEDGTGFQPENFNALVETYGISFPSLPRTATVTR